MAVVVNGTFDHRRHAARACPAAPDAVGGTRSVGSLFMGGASPPRPGRDGARPSGGSVFAYAANVDPRTQNATSICLRRAHRRATLCRGRVRDSHESPAPRTRRSASLRRVRVRLCRERRSSKNAKRHVDLPPPGASEGHALSWPCPRFPRIPASPDATERVPPDGRWRKTAPSIIGGMRRARSPPPGRGRRDPLCRVRVHGWRVPPRAPDATERGGCEKIRKFTLEGFGSGGGVW
ncbi:MAG: hypothetical protein KatS3mg076_2170 [Candidatus Binatia bacterium]|nr:MAG: hypothetical protein KatS3mg076_2170 [Candidatus Binatia bacterium]